MSIIYDALKKVEQSNIKDISLQSDSLKAPAKHKLKIYLLYVLVVCAGFFAVNIFFTFLSHPKISKVKIIVPAATTVVKEQLKQEEPSATVQQQVSADLPVAATPKGMFVLNGIFFSEDEGYALVNNHIVKVGDIVDGALVKQIGVDEVELAVDGLSVKLNTTQR